MCKKRWPVVLVLACVIIMGIFMFPDYTASASNSEAEILLLSQQAYFEKISSLASTSTVTVVLSEKLKIKHQLPTDKIEIQLNSVDNGRRYRNQVSFLDFATGKKNTEIFAYDGKLYQYERSVGGESKKSLYVSRTLPAQNPYRSMNPILFPFLFALRNGEAMSLDVLRQSDRWVGLTPKVTAINKTYINGYYGFTLVAKEIEKNGEKWNYEIFFATNLDFFPVYWKRYNQEGWKQQEGKVLETKKCVTNVGTIIIPLHIEVVEYLENGALAQTTIAEINPDSLKVNCQVNDEIFTLPMSEVSKYWDADFQIGLEPLKL